MNKESYDRWNKIPMKYKLLTSIMAILFSVKIFYFVINQNFNEDSVLSYVSKIDWNDFITYFLLDIAAVLIFTLASTWLIETVFKLSNDIANILFIYSLSFLMVVGPIFLVLCKFNQEFFGVLGIPIAISLYFFNILRKLFKSVKTLENKLNSNSNEKTIHKKRYRNKNRKRNKLHIRNNH